MSSSTDELCPQCAEINFNFSSKAIPDISWTTLLPERCQFCQLLVHCKKNTQDIHQPLTGPIRGVYTGHELQLFVDEDNTSRILDYSIRHCSLTVPNGESQNSASFDVKELKLWLDECEIHQCLPGDHSHKPLPHDFRLIDVQNNCIVRPKTHVKYCALSYVWGSVRPPSLTSFSALESQNSLDAFELPRTIRDAMALCRDKLIDCQFLWVDSVCIEQNIEDIRHRQILSMADVYSQSFLAIIAAAGHDANAGLSPYGSLGRKSNVSYLVRRISQGSFVASLSPQIAAQEIGKSTWASRGWTLQEHALSRRVLFFSGSYTFLRCEKGLWCEDFGLGFSDCFGEDLKWDLPIPPFYRRINDPNRHYSSTFSQLLAQYVRRSLRYEGDILDAFRGILNRMEYSIGIHICGLPSKEFGAALQWTTNLPFPSTPRFGFPSWTWAGWIHIGNLHSPDGRFHDMYEGFDRRATDMSVVNCYRVEDDKSIHTVDECNLERIILHLKEASQTYQSSIERKESAYLENLLRQHFTPQPYPELQAYIEMHNSSKPPLSHHIFLWASCASLYVDRPPQGMNHPKTLDFRIRVEEGTRPIGAIRLRPKWRADQPNNVMEFFISTVGVHSHPLQLKFKIILIQPYHDTHPYHNTQPPVYKRIHVSHTDICQSDWTLANPKSSLIALV